MDAIVSLKLVKRPGAVGQLAGALDAVGLAYERHYIYGGDAGHRRVDVVLSAEEALELPVIGERVATLHGVLEVTQVRSADLAELDDDARFEMTPDHALVNEIVWQHPRIGSLIQEFEWMHRSIRSNWTCRRRSSSNSVPPGPAAGR